ncbi:MAG: DUF547 domain-containing protein [Myxococcales bacterium]|nr:DUF547 domain-containing protein [Myxococcales bacterium]
MLLLLLVACGSHVLTPPPPRHDPTTAWEGLLGRIVTEDGLVRYDVLAQNAEPLARYVGWIAVHGPETDGFRLLDDNRRLAWHLNAYNALVLWGVLQGSTASGVLPGSVNDIAGFFWKQEFGVDGERLSLFSYETRVILPTYQEPLAHAALNCASRSCPPLRNELYTAGGVQNQVEDQMRRWVASADPTRAAVTWDRTAGEFAFSSIFDWYGSDFRAWAGAQTPCEAVRPYAAPAVQAILDAHPDCPRRFYAYDWSLNAASAVAVDEVVHSP